MRNLLLAAVAIGTMISSSNAEAVTVAMATANTNGVSFNAANDGSFSSAAGSQILATFTYNGPLNFRVGPPQNSTSVGDLNSTFFSNGSITNYSGSGSLSGPANANFSTLSSFLGSSGSAANFQYGSLLVFDLGTLAAGTVLTIDHDDGASVYQNNVRLGNTTAGPTSEIIENVTLTSTADTILFYSRENGAPSVLNVAVPEPMSLGLLATGLVGLGALRRKRAV